VSEVAAQIVLNSADADQVHIQEMMTTNQERIETKMDANLREIILDIIEMKDG
jgi:hypothetical protein